MTQMPVQVSYINLRFSHTIGRNSLFGPGFFWPVFVARGPGELLYVVSRAPGYHPEAVRISVCTVEEEFISDFGRGVTEPGPHSHNHADGSLVWPTSLALDREGNIYVADDWLNRVSIFDKDGEYLGKWGKAGTWDGEINRPSGIAFDKDDNLYLVDSLNNRIQIFTKDGHFLAKWGRQGRGDGELNEPWGIDIDRNGNIYIADWRNDRIQKFSPDGQFQMKFGGPGKGEGEFNRPTGVAVDGDGVIYVTDWLNNRLQVFDADGTFITQRTGDATVSKWGKEKLDANSYMWEERERAYALERERLFWGPTHVEVDSQNRIFVADTARSRIQVYAKLPPTYAGSPLGG